MYGSTGECWHLGLPCRSAPGCYPGSSRRFAGSRASLLTVLRDGSGGAVGARTHRLRGGLLVVEAALAVMLLVGAGLLARSFGRLLQVDAGFEPSNVLTAQIYPPGKAWAPGRTRQVVDGVLQRLRATPGVVAAGVGNMAPLNRSTSISGFTLPDPGPDGKERTARALSYVVTPGYAEALGLRLKAGRLPLPADQRTGFQAMLVNEEFVRQYFNDGRPIAGRRYKGLFGPDEVTTEIIGVVGNVLKDGLATKPQSEVYVVPTDYEEIGRPVIVARTIGDPLALIPSVRQMVHDVDSTKAVVNEISTLARLVSASVGQPRFAAAVLAAFAGLALSLAATGLYGVLSYNVSQRRREIGVRAALGATRGRLLALVLRQGLLVTVAGLLLGMLGAAAGTRLMENLLFGVTPLDAAAFRGSPGPSAAGRRRRLRGAGLRAASINPAEALRYD